ENETLLTTVVSQDPIYAYFDVDERTYRRLQASGLASPESKKIAVGLALQGDEGFPRKGLVDFANNTINPSTGTITMRAEFKNPKNEKGRRPFLPGMFVRIQLPLSVPKRSLLVIDRVIGTDQGLKYVYIVDDQDTVQYRRVELGALQGDGLRVIVSGVTEDDRVIASGLQLVRPKEQVKVESKPMLTTSTVADESPTPATGRDSSGSSKGAD
ncbi:MAG: hypothetical protein MI757_19020, partial [Pirellulales bacterium]|nr:hypothetical protein [Pirellulales bacterium]